MNFGVFQAYRFFLGVDGGRSRGNDKKINSHATPPWKTAISRKAQELRIVNAIHYMHISQQC